MAFVSTIKKKEEMSHFARHDRMIKEKISHFVRDDKKKHLGIMAVFTAFGCWRYFANWR